MKIKNMITVELSKCKKLQGSIRKYSFRALGFLQILLIFSLFNVILSEAGERLSDPSKDLKKLSLDELMEIEVATVYGASKHRQKVTEAPSSVTIVTADEIKKYGYRTLSDILRSLRSFYVSYDRSYAYLGVRGFGRTGDYNSRILILVDGHRVNDNIYDSVSIETGFILDIDLINRVEVIRGPSSSLYGNNAFFAVINIITRTPQDLKGMEASGEAGSFDTFRSRLGIAKKWGNGIELALSGSLSDSHGRDLFYKEFDNPSTNNGIAENGDYGRSYNLFSKLSFRDFTIEGAYVSRTKGIPTASFDTDFNDPRNRTVDEQGYVDLRYTHDFGDLFQIMGNLFYDIYKYNGNYIYSGRLNNDIVKGEWWGGEVQFSKTLPEKHKFNAGAEYQFNPKQNQRNWNEDPFELVLDDKRNSNQWALYIQDEVQVFKNLIFNAGVRYDNYEQFGGTANPRLACIFSPFEKTDFKLIYGTAFRAPNVYELYYASFPQKGNPDLDPEKITTYEIVYDQYLSGNIVMTLTGFYNKIKDLIDSTVDPVDNLQVFKNINDVKAKGLELEFEGKWGNGLTGRLSYTFQETEDRDTGKSLVNSPKHLAKLGIIVPVIKEKLFAGLEEHFLSKRKTLTDRHTDSFFITNLTLFSQKLLKGLEASGSIYNMFDKKYSDPGGIEHIQDAIEQDGISFRFKLTYNFVI
jgi:outer membrane receptor for ferrienterochelin and colicins